MEHWGSFTTKGGERERERKRKRKRERKKKRERELGWSYGFVKRGYSPK